MESGAGSTMLKFGLLLVLANALLKIVIGIGLWKMGLDFKLIGNKSSTNYVEEQIAEGDSNVFNNRQGVIYGSSEQNDNF